MPALDNAFQKAAEEWFQDTLKENPIQASFLGIHTYDAEMPDLSPESVERWTQQTRSWLERFRSFDPDSLSPENRIDRTVVLADLTTQLEDLERGMFATSPGLYLDGAIGSIYVLLTREFAPLEVRMASILGRLRQIPDVLAQGQRQLTRPPRIYTEIAIGMAQGGVGFFQALVPPAAAQVPALEAEVLAANERAIAAMQEYTRFLQEDLLPRSDNEFALGRERFERRLREYHMLDYTAGSLAQAGHDLIALTQNQMEKLAREIDATKTWQEIVAESKQLHPTAEGLLEAYRTAMRESREFILRHDLVDLPENEVLQVVETPAFMRALIPYAAYQNPAPFDERQEGLFFVTPVDTTAAAAVQEQQLEGHNSLGIPITSLHEGYPGHHTQLCWANRNGSLIRKAAGFSTLFAEGWAFYCEELMEQLGYISDPRAKLLRLKDQLWRACRIVIDVSLHCQGMTVEQAEQTLVDVAKIEPVNARAEVARYTMSPTQPMSYLIGKLELLKLAEEYRERKGAAFNLKQFHLDLLAHGTIAPALIRELVLR